MVHAATRATLRGGNTNTPLMWLPDDDTRAVEIAELLLAHGADPAIRNTEGKTAADIAETRGLSAAAALLRSRAG